MYTPNLVSILFDDQPLSIFKFDDVMPTLRIVSRFFRFQVIISRHMQRNEYSLKMNVFFVLRQRRLRTSRHGFQICRTKSGRQIFEICHGS